MIWLEEVEHQVARDTAAPRDTVRHSGDDYEQVARRSQQQKQARLARQLQAEQERRSAVAIADDGWEDYSDEAEAPAELLQRSASSRRGSTASSTSRLTPPRPRRKSTAGGAGWSYTRTLAEARETLGVGPDASAPQLQAALEAAISSALASGMQQSAKAATFKKLKQAHNLLVAQPPRQRA